MQKNYQWVASQSVIKIKKIKKLLVMKQSRTVSNEVYMRLYKTMQESLPYFSTYFSLIFQMIPSSELKHPGLYTAVPIQTMPRKYIGSHRNRINTSSVHLNNSNFPSQATGYCKEISAKTSHLRNM